MAWDPGTIISSALAGLTSLGFIILLIVVYRNGKKNAQQEQGEKDAVLKDKLQEEFVKPKPTSRDDRDSMLNGDF